jgi:Domain of unknown function (DUF6985)
MDPTRRESILAAARSLGSDRLNHLVQMVHEARWLGRLRRWQEKVLSELPGVAPVTFAEFVEAFSDAVPMSEPPPVRKEDMLAVPGLPPLIWQRGSGWKCDALLPAWAGFTPRLSGEGQPGEGPPTTGEVTVSFDCPDIYARTPPSAAQVAAFRRLAEGRGAIRDAVLQAAFDYLRSWIDNEEYCQTIAEELGGPLVEPSQLTRLIALNIVGISVEDAGGQASVDLEFSGVWEYEHEAFIATLAGDRVTDVGTR